MPKERINQPRMTLLLLQEAIWQVDDRVNVILESVADQEAELLRVKRLSDLHSQRLEFLESILKTIRSGGSRNG